MRIIFIPQYPSKMRYSEWWITEFPKQFRERGFEVLTVGEKYAEVTRSDLDMFSPIDQAIKFETEQINEYMSLELRDDDILFWADTSFPGLFGHVLFHKKPKKLYGFCHATSLNHGDYYEPDRHYKYPIERALMTMFDKVFVGSYYHAKKISDIPTMVTYLPFQPYEGTLELFVPKEHLFMSASRPNPQKVDLELEKEIERIYNTKIFRPVSNTWEEYFANLRASKFLLITSKEDTFGYQIVDAVTNNCIPIAPNKCAYPELLISEYLYDECSSVLPDWSIAALFEKDLMRFTEYEVTDDEYPGVPKLKCSEQMRSFYDVICNEMRSE